MRERDSPRPAPVRVSRLTYVGEQGYELYMPAEFATHVFDRLVEAGAAFGLQMGGYFAINALRMEKGYRHWGHRINASLGLGYVTAEGGVTEDWLASGKFEVEIAWKRYPALVQLRSWYDPTGEKLKG